MKIPEVLEEWFIRIYGNNRYLEKAKMFAPEEVQKRVDYIFDNVLERAARIKAQCEASKVPVPEGCFMTEEEDGEMAKWLREEMSREVMEYRKEIGEETDETRARIRRNIESFSPSTAKVIFEEELKPRLDRRGR